MAECSKQEHLEASSLVISLSRKLSRHSVYVNSTKHYYVFAFVNGIRFTWRQINVVPTGKRDA